LAEAMLSHRRLAHRRWFQVAKTPRWHIVSTVHVSGLDSVDIMQVNTRAQR
jgi:hypothetical protein